jgi:hypothetical protein
VRLSRVVEPTILRVRPRAEVSSVEIEGEPATRFDTRAALDAAAAGFFVDAVGFVWVKLATSAAEVEVELFGGG